MEDGDGARPEAYVVAEYQAATDAYLHYDSFRWQSGSLLVAGAFVFLGFLASGSRSPLLDVGALTVTFVMSVWLLYAQHHRNLYLFKLHRIAELEVQMGAEQNLRFRPDGDHRARYRPVGLAGHVLDRVMAVGISLAAIVIASMKGSAGAFSIVALVLIAGTLLWAVVQDSQVRRAIK